MEETKWKYNNFNMQVWNIHCHSTEKNGLMTRKNKDRSPVQETNSVAPALASRTFNNILYQGFWKFHPYGISICNQCVLTWSDSLMDHSFPWRLLQDFYVYNILIPPLQPTLLPHSFTHYPFMGYFRWKPSCHRKSRKFGWKPHNSMTRAIFYVYKDNTVWLKDVKNRCQIEQ